MNISSGRGEGCRNYVHPAGIDNCLHNPKPSTERGKRRHQNRNEQQQKHAVHAWEMPRSCRKSKKQLVLESSGGRN